jgi:glyoxylase-like metal-dependent hydrolase (beta-lactamase superfamily II)
MSLSRASVALVTLACASCSTAPPARAPAPSTAAPSDPDPARLQDDLDARDGVFVHTSAPWTFDTNLWFIEGPTGVVVIDTLFLPSDATKALATIRARTSKPVVLAVVLHPNPDKFNGAEVFKSAGARVVTSAHVFAQIPKVAEKRRRAFLERYAPDYPATDPPVESFGDATTTISAGGLDVTLHVLAGPGCSDAHVVATVRTGSAGGSATHVFAGDLVAEGTHAWLELGYAREWIARLDEIAALAPDPIRVHPGRGRAGGRERIADQRAYLARVLALVDEAHPTWPAPVGAIDAVRAQLKREYPALRYGVFLYGLDEVWRREAERAR